MPTLRTKLTAQEALVSALAYKVRVVPKAGLLHSPASPSLTYYANL